MLMMQKSVRTTPFGYYLAHVAVADTGYLYFGLIPTILKSTGVEDILSYHQIICKFGKFFHYSSGDFAIWLVLAVTMDRFIVVKYPFKAKILCTLRRAKVVCVALLLLSCAFNSYLFITRDLITVNSSPLPICGILPQHAYFETYILPWYNIVGLVAIPGTTMFILNTLIVLTLWKQSRIQQNLSNDVHGVTSVQTVRTTITLLAVSTMFVILVCPCFLILSLLSYINLNSVNIQYTLSVCLTLIYINHSCNIFLYILTSQQFRDTLKVWFCRCSTNR